MMTLQEMIALADEHDAISRSVLEMSDEEWQANGLAMATRQDELANEMAAALRTIAEQIQAAEPAAWIECLDGGSTAYDLTDAGRSLPVGEYQLYTHPSPAPCDTLKQRSDDEES